MGVEIQPTAAAQWIALINRVEMAPATFTNEPSLAELQETETVYIRAMEYLVADGVKEEEARKSVCWRRLHQLHQALPDRYGEPRALVLSLREHHRGQSAS